ncbi:Myb-like domain-containing protein [Entamoeba marina]
MSWSTVEQLVLVEAIQYSSYYCVNRLDHWKLVSDLVIRTLSCSGDVDKIKYSDVACYDQYTLLEKIHFQNFSQQQSFVETLNSFLRRKRIEELDREMEQTKMVMSQLQQMV